MNGQSVPVPPVFACNEDRWAYYQQQRETLRANCLPPEGSGLTTTRLESWDGRAVLTSRFTTDLPRWLNHDVYRVDVDGAPVIEEATTPKAVAACFEVVHRHVLAHPKPAPSRTRRRSA
ncbi:hypothetical protein [Deinococcus soli (ex Cha et al. 2016)]|uniref:Uncharacterized protein n=2 Tax=Deinococcus soli (ex Cha et al. 2016) TaxID=1309411 RepID=A0ACC6KHD0_9DEIO|nr:hypothetical protein [Deinococcus soli (ex Cha et al. 2016)]MDR6218878.1 hypothetical protein [Deinococcus soli (ex Cha et al. 2016)]MDR6328675.1 hypothetical protein [Deinococcus soli (ex Cha et al. 2016)]MDR6751838.1 hypothetical protein [Deinococcus soli (ex Cha et al. 2016)]